MTTINTVEELADLVKNAPSTPLAIPDGEPHSAERLLGSIRHMQEHGGLRDPENWLPATVLVPATRPSDDVREAVARAIRLADIPSHICMSESFVLADAALSATRPATVSAETHTEDTLLKVYRALERAGNYTVNPQDAVREMQNEGILFRERAAGIEVAE